MATNRFRFRNNLSSWLKVSLIICGVLQLVTAVLALRLNIQIKEFAEFVSPSGLMDLTSTADSLDLAETIANITTIATVIFLLVWLNRYYRAWGRPRVRIMGSISLVVIVIAIGVRLLAARRESSAIQISELAFDPVFVLNALRRSLLFKGLGFLFGAISTVFVFLYVRPIAKRNWI